MLKYKDNDMLNYRIYQDKTIFSVRNSGLKFSVHCEVRGLEYIKFDREIKSKFVI